MELVVRKNELLRELQLFQGIVERKNTIPILANVLLEAKGDEVRMLATDLEVALRSRCQALVTKGGSLTLPAGEAFRADMTVTRDASGHMPTFPYKSVLALGHPDFMIHAALLIVVQHAEADWPAGDAMLQSLSFI